MAHFSTDILILGGGIAGLWLNARLRRLGYASLVLESSYLGGGQTVKSQGIIHGGTKYALQGILTGSSEAIAEMPKRWRAALQGAGELDLSGVRVLSEAHYLWSPGSLASNLTSFFASKAMRGRVTATAGKDLPLPLQNPAFKGRVYALDELVLDVPSLIQRLVQLGGDSLIQAQHLEPFYQDQQLSGVVVEGQVIQAQRIVLCAGAGNADLLDQLALTQPHMQTRPLHMVLVKAPSLQPLYAHCLGSGPKPRITITSHPTADGQWLWYLGGDLAEAEGVARDSAAQIHQARRELEQLLPWLDLSQSQWATLRIDRAEPAQSGLVRPDNAFLSEQGRLLIGWPTKLALAPDLSDRVLNALEAAQIRPQASVIRPNLPVPSVSPPFWEGLL